MDEDIACEIDIAFCVSLHSIVFSGIRGVPQSLGGFVVGYGMDKHEGMMTIGV